MTRTRALIEDAFLAVMEEKGFEGLSVQDVADRAGINRVTFYAHFDDTFALLRHAVQKAFEAEVVSRCLSDRVLDRDSTRDLFLAVCRYVAGLHEHCKPPHDHLDWVLGEVISEHCARLFQRWPTASGQAAAHARPQAATAAGSALYALASQWGQTKRRGTAPAFVESALPIVAGILGLT